MTRTDPIFIVGTERSGSNLLRLILNAHSEITVPHPPHIMAYFAPLEKRYGDSASDRNWARLTDDVITHVRRHIYPWSSPLNRSELLAIQPPRDLFDLFAAIYEQHRAATGKPRWCCKSTFMIHYTGRILSRYPQARLIWLVRDPRDVAVSSKKSVFNPYHPYFTSKLWNEQQLLGLELQERVSSRNLMRVHYEDLVSNPESKVSSICQFLDITFEPGMLRFFESEEAKTSASLSREWRNTGAPIMTANFVLFRKKLSESEIEVVEQQARPAMQLLGYTPVAQKPAEQPGLLRRCYYRLLNELLRLRVEYHSWRQDRNHWLRWGRWMRMLMVRARLRFRLHETGSRGFGWRRKLSDL